MTLPANKGQPPNIKSAIAQGPVPQGNLTAPQNGQPGGNASSQNPYTLYLVAEAGPKLNSASGHIFIGGRKPDGSMEASGFYPQPVTWDPRTWLNKIYGGGEIHNNTPEFKAALSGDPSYAMKAYHVDKATYDAAMTDMKNYPQQHNYDLLYNNCGAAALGSLNHAGVSPSFYIPMTYPAMYYDAIKRGY